MYASNEFCFVFLYVNRTLLFLKLKTRLFAQLVYIFHFRRDISAGPSKQERLFGLERTF